MDSEDYEAWLISVLGVEAWIEFRNSVKNAPEFEPIALCLMIDKLTH